MVEHPPHSYRFDDFFLDPSRRMLLHRGAPIPLTPKAFDTLLVLVKARGRVLAKETLLSTVWAETFVEEATLAQNISTLRRALGCDRNGRRLIETVPKHGYRFAVQVYEIPETHHEIVLESHTKTMILSHEIEDSAPPNSVLTPQTGHVEPSGGPQTKSGLLRNTRRLLTVAAISIVVVSFAAFVILRIKAKDRDLAFTRLDKMRVSKLTNNGGIRAAAISPDGNYVAYVVAEAGSQSLSVKQTTGSSNVQIVAPTHSTFRALSFSPDSKTIYFSRYESSLIGDLWQVPLLGGPLRKILSDIDSNITFSPDGGKLAFFRNNPQRRETSLMIANLDGSEQSTIATQRGDFRGDGPSWSPDGNNIAFPAFIGEASRGKASLFKVDVNTRVESPLTSRTWKAIGQVVWLTDGKRLAFDAWDDSTAVFSAQLWEVNDPGGEVRRITNDLNTYAGVSIPRSANSLITTQFERTANLWIGPVSNPANSEQVTSGAGDKRGEVMGLAWGPNNKIVYGSDEGGTLDLWTIDAKEKIKRQLTADPALDLKPTIAPNGNFVVYVSGRTGSQHLWTMNVDGSNARQLTSGNTETAPGISPDAS